MRGISAFFYSIKQGMKNIRHNGMFSLASIGTIAACLFLFGVFYFVLSNFQYMIHSAETSFGVTVFFDEQLKQDEIDQIGEKIKVREEVDRINFVSAEEAWEKFKKENFKGAKDLEETFAEDNPLQDSASYEVYLRDVSKQKELVRYIQSLEGVRKVKSSDSTAASLHNINLLVGYVSVTIIILLLAIAIFLINTTISMGISVRKEEIGIMKLMGASDFFIRAPFIVEGVFIGLLGAFIPLVALYFMYDRLIVFISSKFNILSDILVFLDIKTVFSVLMPVSIAIGVGIGFIGSIMTVRKHIRI